MAADMEDYKTQYNTLEELGKGKFGTVFKVEEKTSGTIAAAKHIKIRRRENRARVQEEIDILQSLNNQHIVSFHAAFHSSQEIVVITEYLDGGELFERVSCEMYTLTELECCSFIRQLCSGLQYLHKMQIIHLDLKPENIVCIDRSTTDIKIIDFGLARRMDTGEQVKTLNGTPEFLAPEVLAYDSIGFETDMWAVGVITYILVSGLSPFLGDSDNETYTNIQRLDYSFDFEDFDSISELAKEFISSLLLKKRSDRLSSEQCLNHPWLQPVGRSTMVIKTENLRAYISKRRWHRFGRGVLALKRISGIQKKSLDEESASTSSSSSVSSWRSSMSSASSLPPCDLVAAEYQELILIEEDSGNEETDIKVRKLSDYTTSGVEEGIKKNTDRSKERNVSRIRTPSESSTSTTDDEGSEQEINDNHLESDKKDFQTSTATSTDDNNEYSDDNSNDGGDDNNNDECGDLNGHVGTEKQEAYAGIMINVENVDKDDKSTMEAQENSDTLSDLKWNSRFDMKKYSRTSTRAEKGTVSGMVSRFQHLNLGDTAENAGKLKFRKSMKTRPRNVKLLAERFAN